MRNRDRGFLPEHLSRTEVHQGWTPGVLQDNGRQAPPPAGIAISESQSKAYVVNGGSVSVLSLVTHTQLAEVSIPVGTEPLGLAIDYDGQTAYVTNYGDGTVSYFTVPG
jgi:YVTN family beta-propeller protein